MVPRVAIRGGNSMANIHQCRAGALGGGLECIFRIANLIGGEVQGYSCAISSKDEYNLEPETNSDGSINFQHVNQHDPIRIGDPAITWENLTSHQTGRNYDGRDFDAGMEFHPLYSVSEHNFPTRSKIGTEDVGEIMGEDNPSIVNSGWIEQKFYGKSNVEYCRAGIYGRFDRNQNMVMHQALRSHIGVPGFINYTLQNPRVTKTFFLESASIGDILVYTKATFKDPKVADRMAEGMIASKEGEFINLWVLMRNNFVPEHEIKKFMTEVSFETMAGIYRSKPNIQAFLNLYINLPRIRWHHKSKDEDGKEVVKITSIDEKYIRIYRENILNWILNYPGLKDITPGLGVKYPKNHRYWFLKQLMYLALRVDKIMNPKVILPEWLVNICKETDEPVLNVFGEVKKFSELPDDLKSDFVSAKVHHLDTDNPQDIVMNVYPGMLDIKSEMRKEGLDPDELGCQGWGQFVRILKLGRRWSMVEVFNAWEHFVPSWIQDDPKFFYEWLHEVASKPVEPDYTVSQEELNEITNRLGKDPIVAGEAQPLQKESDISLGALSSSKAFAANILEASLEWDDWDTWEDWDPAHIPIQNWYEATARIQSIRESNHETFWSSLAKIAARGGVFEEDYKTVKSKLADETHEESIHPDSEIVVMDGITQTGLDSSDRTDIRGYDHRTDEFSNLNEGGNTCLGEE
jgi:hypothetical protein